MSQKTSVFAALAVLAGAGVMVSASAYAQTSGMERRDDRRDDRQSGRAAKQACKAGDEKSRPECRQTKRATKHAPDQPAPAASQPPPH